MSDQFHPGIGELSKDTELLTPTGWINITSVTKETLIAQYFAIDGIGCVSFAYPMSLSRSLNIVEKAFWVRNAEKHVDQLVGPNHGLVYGGASNKLVVVPVEKQIPYRAKFINGGFLTNTGVDLETSLTPNERLRIALQADGTIYRQSGVSERVTFRLKKERKIERIVSLLNSVGIEYKTCPSNTDGCTAFYFTDTPGTYDKNFDCVDLSKVGAKWCQEFIHELVNWDCSDRGSKKIQYFNNNKVAIDRAQAIGALAGYRTCVSARNRPGTNWNTAYTLSMSGNTKWTTGEVIEKTLVDYNDYTYRVMVPSNILVIRRNDAISVTACGTELHGREIGSLDLKATFITE